MKVAVMAMNLTTLIREFQYLNLAEEKIPLKLKRDGKDLSYLYDIYIYILGGRCQCWQQDNQFAHE